MTKKIINFKSIAVALALFSLFAGPLASLASGAQFNTDPQDKPTLRVSNYTQNPGSTNWSSSISNVHVGDIVSFVFYYHNTGDQTANNTRAAVSFNYGSGVSANGTISADNALSAYGSASVYPASGETITSLTFDSAEWYPNQSTSPVGAQGGPTTFILGNITPGWGSQGYLVARYKTVGQGQPPIGTNGATCLSINAPSSVNSGQTFSASVNMKNTGTKTWTTGSWPVSGYFLGSQNPQDNQTWGLGRVSLPSSPIAPGQTANFSFTATAPAVSSASNKVFAWQMVQEAVEWFGQTCSKTISVNPIPVANPTLNITPSSATVNVGSGTNFHANYDPDGVGPLSGSEVTVSSAWSSSNSSVASVSQGHVTGIYQGSATITATYNNLSATAYVTVNAVNPPPSGSAPVVSTNSATGVNQSSATLNGYGTPKGAATSCWFEYGASAGLGQTIGNRSIGSGNSAVSLNSYLSGLSANTTYYFRAACQNSYGTTRGSVLSFQTSNNPPVGNPTLTVSPTSGSISVGQNFKFFAMYDADGPQGSQSPTDVSYSTSWTSSNSSVASVASAGNTTGLSNGTALITAVYSGLTATGSLNVSGTTGGNSPTISTNSATNINQTAATLNGQVNPNGFATTYWFEYGTTYSLGQTTFTQNAGSGTGNISAIQSISGLTSNTTYYFRVTAQNQYGTSHGQILSFTTQNGGGGGAATFTISPSSATVNVGSGTGLRAYYDADGSGSGAQVDVTSSAYWSSSNSSVAGVSQGYVTGVNQGSATITVTYLSLSATAYVSVIGGTQGSAPIASTNGATNIAQNYATLNGLVNPNNAATTYWFEYGTTYSLGQTVGNQSIGSGSSAQNVSYTVYGLNANTTYYFRITAQNQYGTSQGQILNFMTNGSGGCVYNCGGSAPIVTTNYVSNQTLNSATMNGTVNPNGSNANYWFEYGQTSSLGQTTGFQYLGNYSGPQNVSAQIYNLLSNMNYYYRVVAQNSYGTTYGSVYNFTTGNNNSGNCNYNGGGYYGNSAPCVQTLTPTNLGNNYATFNAQVSSNGNGSDSIVGWFEYGINSNSLTYTTNNSFIPSYATNYNFSNGVTNLTENTGYYVRAVARNSYGTSYGQTYQFSTTGNGGGTNLPAVLTKQATYVGRNSALLNGSANPNSGVGNAWFEYGPSASLGLRTNMQPIGSGNSYVDTAFALTSLLQNTTYYFRIVAQTPAGTSYGSILRFTTTGTVVPPVDPPIEPPIIVGSSCLKLSPAIYPSSGVVAGDEAVYTLTYKNDCGYDLSNAALQIVLPLEASFVASNNSFASQNSNTLSYNLGLVQSGYQGVVEIRNKIGSNVEKGNSLVYGSTMNWTDKKGKFQTTSAYITALVGGGAVAGLASLLSIFGGWGWLWLLLLLLIIFAIYWLFFRKEEKTAVQKIEQSIA